jgi:hypothetical protein
MSTQISYKHKPVNGGEHGEKKHTVVLYSPDSDFCMSLSMFFQDMYKVITTTDPEMLLDIVDAYQPELAIVDASPGERMNRRFETMKRADEHLRIMVLYVPKIQGSPRDVRRVPCVDAMLSHPIDLTDVMQQADFLLALQQKGIGYGQQSDTNTSGTG